MSMKTETEFNESIEMTVNEYERKLFSNLEKLQSFDAVQTGGQALGELIPLLTRENDSLNIFMKHLVSTKTNHGKGKKEILRLITIAAQHHKKDIFPNLPRCMKLICKLLQESDTTIRDICTSCVSELSSEVSPLKPEKQDKHFDLIWKPLSDCMNELNRITQQGAGYCMIEMIKNFPVDSQNPKSHYVLGHMNVILSRFKELLFGKVCFCAPQIMTCLGALVESTTSASLPFIQTITSYLAEGLAGKVSQSDWNTRKAAAESFTLIAFTLRDQIAPYKDQITEVLTKAKYDKLKPVRDAVVESLKTYQLWVKSDQENTPPPETGSLLKSTSKITQTKTTTSLSKKNTTKLSTLPVDSKKTTTTSRLSALPVDSKKTATSNLEKTTDTTEPVKTEKKKGPPKGWTKNPKFFEIKQTYQEGNSVAEDNETTKPLQTPQKRVQITAPKNPIQQKNMIPQSNSTPKPPTTFSFATHFEPSIESDDEQEEIPSFMKNVQNHEKKLNKTNDKIQDKIQDKTIDKIQDKTIDKIQDKTQDKIQDKTIDKDIDKTIDKIQDKSKIKKEDKTDFSTIIEDSLLEETSPDSETNIITENNEHETLPSHFEHITINDSQESLDLNEKSLDLNEYIGDDTNNEPVEIDPLTESQLQSDDKKNNTLDKFSKNENENNEDEFEGLSDLDLELIDNSDEEDTHNMTIEEKLKNLEKLSHQIRRQHSPETDPHEQRIKDLEYIISQQNKEFSAMAQQQQKLFSLFEQFTIKTNTFMENIENRLSNIEKSQLQKEEKEE